MCITGAVYADVLCHCVDKKSLPCISRCSHIPETTDDDDDDVGATSRRAATNVGAETAALSTVLAFSESSRPASSPCCRRPDHLLTSLSSHQLTTTVTVDSRDVIEMHRMDDSDDVSPVVSL